MPLFEIETESHIIITWAADQDAAAVVATLRGVQANAPASQLVATRVDPYADTGKLTDDVRASVNRTMLEAQASKRQRNLTILLAIAVFAITSAIGLLVYFFVF